MEEGKGEEGHFIACLHFLWGVCPLRGLTECPRHWCLCCAALHVQNAILRPLEFKTDGLFLLRLMSEISEVRTIHLGRQLWLTPQGFSNNLKGWWGIC